MNINNVAKSVVKGVNDAANHSAKAAARANGVSAAAQAAQGAFNQGSANNANAIGSQRILDMYKFNSAQAAMANQFSSDMWDRTAAWNEYMWNKQAEFNHNEAILQRQWSEYMEGTRYQRSMQDMAQAGLNPILAYGGIATGAGSASAANVGGVTMSPMNGQAASGSTMNGISASEGNYSGQMEYMSGLLGIFGAAIDGLSSAYKSMSELSKSGDNTLSEIIKAFGTVMDPDSWNKNNPDAPINNPNTKFNRFKHNIEQFIDDKKNHRK